MKKTTKQIKTFGPSRTTIEIPAGLRVIPIPPVPTGAYKDCYFLDEFPVNIFPLNSFARHDAVHYGVVFKSSEITD